MSMQAASNMVLISGIPLGAWLMKSDHIVLPQCP